MNFVKKNIKLIVGIIIGAVLISGISVYATTTYLASQVNYTTNKNAEIKSVEQALNDLYTKISNDTDNIVISSGDNYTTTQTYSKAYIIVTRLLPNPPVFKRNDTDVTPIKTRTSLNNEYSTYIYSAENVTPAEEWIFRGTAEVLFFK